MHPVNIPENQAAFQRYSWLRLEAESAVTFGGPAGRILRLQHAPNDRRRTHTNAGSSDRLSSACANATVS